MPTLPRIGASRRNQGAPMAGRTPHVPGIGEDKTFQHLVYDLHRIVDEFPHGQPPLKSGFQGQSDAKELVVHGLYSQS